MSMDQEPSSLEQDVANHIGSARRVAIAKAALAHDICGRCVLCVCGVKQAKLYTTEERLLLAAIRKSVLGPEAEQQGDLKAKDGCAMCLGVMKWAEEVAPAVSARMEELGYHRRATQGFVLGVTLTSSNLIRQNLVGEHIQKTLKAQNGSENPGFLALNVKDGMLDMKEAYRFAVGQCVGRCETSLKLLLCHRTCMWCHAHVKQYPACRSSSDNVT
jgi:hypothetical protein